MNIAAIANQLSQTSSIALLSWWSSLELKAKGLPNHSWECSLLRNIENDALIELSPRLLQEVETFASRLAFSNHVDPLINAKSAMNDSTNSGHHPCMVCLGPPGQIQSSLIRFTPVYSLINPKHSVLLSSWALSCPTPQHFMNAFGSNAAFQSAVNPKAILQGHVQSLFWTSEDEVAQFSQQYGKANVPYFLGLEEFGSSTNPVVPRACLRLLPKVDLYVPTGFDAFVHPLFVPPSQISPLPTAGRTRNSYPSSGPGAEEVVSLPVTANNVELMNYL